MLQRIWGSAAAAEPLCTQHTNHQHQGRAGRLTGTCPGNHHTVSPVARSGARCSVVPVSCRIRSHSHSSWWPPCDRQVGSETLTAEISVVPVRPAPVTNDRARVWAEKEIRGVGERADRTADRLRVKGAEKRAGGWRPRRVLCPSCPGVWSADRKGRGCSPPQEMQRRNAWWGDTQGSHGSGVREELLGQGSKDAQSHLQAVWADARQRPQWKQESGGQRYREITTKTISRVLKN